METDESNEDVLSNITLVTKLLDEASIDEVIRGYRQLLPELIHQAGEIVVEESGDPGDKNKFIVACSKLLLYNKFLQQHVEPWLCKIGAPWSQSSDEPTSKRIKLCQDLETKVLGASLNLLIHCDRLKESWSWVEIFPMLTSANTEARFIIIEILRVIFRLSEASVEVVRRRFLINSDSSELGLKTYLTPTQEVLMLAADSPQQEHDVLQSKVASIKHVSLPKCSARHQQQQVSCMIEVDSARHNLEMVGAAVSVGQPVLLVGEVGVGKTSLVLEWGARTGQEVVTLQVSDNTDARLLIGVYRCTEIPGQWINIVNTLTMSL